MWSRESDRYPARAHKRHLQRPLTLAAGVIGATVMPHAIYLHSALTQSRVRPDSDAERHRLVRFSNREVFIALAFAGLVNMAVLMMASGGFTKVRHHGIR